MKKNHSMFVYNGAPIIQIFWICRC